VVAAKWDNLRGIFNQYGAGNKLLFNREGAIICGRFHYDPDYDEIYTSEEFELTNAYYLTKSFASYIATDLDANIWYSITGWRYLGLMKSNLDPLPAYYANKFARLKLGNAVFVEKDKPNQISLFTDSI
jgi:hypothetical protein